MRLTKYLRECFVKAVFADIPKPICPSNELVQNALYDNFDPLIKAVYDDEKLRKALTTSYRYVNGCGGTYLITAGIDYNKLPIMVMFTKDLEKYDAARASLRAVADGCMNLKQLQAALPDLVKYMVSEAAPTPVNLPVITGTIDALKALGWKQ